MRIVSWNHYACKVIVVWWKRVGSQCGEIVVNGVCVYVCVPRWHRSLKLMDFCVRVALIVDTLFPRAAAAPLCRVIGSGNGE